MFVLYRPHERIAFVRSYLVLKVVGLVLIQMSARRTLGFVVDPRPLPLCRCMLVLCTTVPGWVLSGVGHYRRWSEEDVLLKRMRVSTAKH